MLCERCHQNPVSVHMQQTVNGETTEMHLCQSCASQFEMPISFEHFFQGFLDSYLSSASETGSPAKNAAAKLRCPSCGLTYSEFKRTSRLGCGNCYTAFKKELDTILKNIHGSNVHQGKFPKKSGAALFNKRKAESLKLQLSKAIENEEFEEAVRLRDEIRMLQGGASNE